MRRIDFLDFLKGVLIFLVATGHFLEYGVYQGHGFWDDPLFKWIYMFHMPLFMAVAGYLSQPGLDRTSATRAIRARFLTYVVPIIAWSTLYCLAVDCLAHPLSRQSLLEFPVYLAGQIIGDLWFLWALFGAILLTSLARLAGRFFPLVYPLSFLVVLCLPEWGNLVHLNYTYPFFQIGYAFARWGIPGWLTRHRMFVFLAALPPAAACYLSVNHATYVYNSGMLLTGENLPNVLLRYAGALTMAPVVLCALHFLHDRLSEEIRAPFNAFGRDSIYIYILQNYLFMFVDRLGGRFHFHRTGTLFGWLLALVAGLVVCAGCHLAGTLLARNPVLGAILFGKQRKASLRPVPAAVA